MKKIHELRAELEEKKKEARELNKRGKCDEASKIIEEIKIKKTEIENMEKIEEDEMRDLRRQSKEKTGIETMGELRMLNKNNVTQIYKGERNLNLGKYIRGALTGNWDNAENEKNEFRSLSTSTGSVLIPKGLSSEILQLIMNRSLIYKSGVPVVDMPNGNLTIAKVIKNPKYGFKAELEEVEPQDANFEGIDLKGKMVYGLMKVSLETLESADNIDIVLKQAMADSIASAIDTSMLYGKEDKEIKGIFNYDNINVIEANEVSYKPFVNAVGKIRTKNGEPTIIGVNADIDTQLNLLTDTTGQPLNAPNVINNLERYISNQLEDNVEHGSEAIVFDPKSMIIGQQVQFKFATSESLGFNDGSVWLRVYALLDMAILRPEFITIIKKLKNETL